MELGWVRESRTMLPGVRSGQGQGTTSKSGSQGAREPGFSSPLPLASEWSSGSLADEEKATFALGGRRDDWRRARWTGTISELELEPGGPGEGGGGGVSRDGHRQGISVRIEVQEQIDLASSRSRDIWTSKTWGD